MGELKILALEARNHLYDVLKDTELWQKAMHSMLLLSHINPNRSIDPAWKDSRIAMESRMASRDQVTSEREGD